MTVRTEQRLVVEFTKMTGAGNDFIVVDNRFFHFTDDELSEMASRYCPRKTGIGADGLLALSSVGSDSSARFRMGYWNADGTVGTMCGNGARCLARFASISGISGHPMAFESDAGTVMADVPESIEEDVRVYLPTYRDYRPELKPESGGGAIDSVDFIWTGTEHLVVFVDDVASAPVQYLGSVLRNDRSLSDVGANASFVQVISEGGERPGSRLNVRTYERGVEEETLACGTGALASALCARLSGRALTDRIQVKMPGGTLTVGFTGGIESPENLILEGPAEVVYRGSFEM
jgi:diaminopimelate epimerase